MLFFLLFGSSFFAVKAQEWVNVKEFIEKGTSSPDAEFGASAVKIKTYIEDVNPTLDNLNKLKYNGLNSENYEVIDLQVSDLNNLLGRNLIFETVRTVIVRIPDTSVLGDKLRIGLETAFPNLEFLLFLIEYQICPPDNSIDCIDGKLNPIINEYKTGLPRLLYQISIPE